MIGAILGVLASVGGGEVFRARTLLYLGQPFTTSGGGQIQSLATNPKTVSQIIRSEAALRRASAASGLTLGQLRGHVTSAAVVSAGQAKNVSPLVEITVDALRGQKAEKAANSLADSVIGVVSTYVDQKIALLNKQIASSRAELADIDARVSNAVAQQQAVIDDKTISSTDKLIAISTSTTRSASPSSAAAPCSRSCSRTSSCSRWPRTSRRARSCRRAVASKTTATSRRNAALIGALIGLLLGALAAAIADPFLQRRAARSAA